MPDKRELTDANVLPVAANDDATSASLLERAKARDETAWSRLVELYDPLVAQWCRIEHVADADVADIRQEVFVAVARKLGDFRREPPHLTFRGWLRTVTRNKIRDLRRRQQKLPDAAGGSEAQAMLAELPDEAAEDESSVDQEKSTLYRRVLQMMETGFEPTTWKAFWRTTIDGQSPEDAAAELHISIGAVYTARSRVRKRLQEEFGDLLGL